MMTALLHGAQMAPIAIAWLRCSIGHAHAKALARRRRTAYHRHVTDKEVAEFDISICTRRTSRHAAIILFVLPTCAFNGGLGGGAERHAGYLVRRYVNPAKFRLPHLTLSGGLKPVQGGHHA